MRVGRCACCSVQGVVWGEPVGMCIAHLDALENEGRRKLSAAQVRALRDERAGGASYGALARRYGLSKSTARDVALSVHYREVAA